MGIDSGGFLDGVKLGGTGPGTCIAQAGRIIIDSFRHGKHAPRAVAPYLREIYL